jgi:hypothetical protein
MYIRICIYGERGYDDDDNDDSSDDRYVRVCIRT